MKIFSPLQNHILAKLKNASALRYSELMPEQKVANDLFNYHLQYLVDKGYVTKLDEGYSLSETGVQHVADPFPVDMDREQKITSLFKLNVITIVSRVENGRLQILNQLRKSNPSYGKVGVMGGVVYKGETITDGATRKLKEETGLEATFVLVGMTRRMLYKEGELFSDVLFPIAYASESVGDLQVETDFGENFWVDLDQALENDKPQHDSIKGIYEALERIKAGTIREQPFFFTEDIHL